MGMLELSLFVSMNTFLFLPVFKTFSIQNKRGLMTAPSSGNCVLITGDLALDWHIINQAQNQGDSIGWNRNLWTRACSQIGGAGLLADLIKHSTTLDPQLQSTTFLTPNISDQPFHPCQDQFHNAYAFGLHSQRESNPFGVCHSSLGWTRSKVMSRMAQCPSPSKAPRRPIYS